MEALKKSVAEAKERKAPAKKAASPGQRARAAAKK